MAHENSFGGQHLDAQPFHLNLLAAAGVRRVGVLVRIHGMRSSRSSAILVHPSCHPSWHPSGIGSIRARTSGAAWLGRLVTNVPRT
jgi:hypothetical protein